MDMAHAGIYHRSEIPMLPSPSAIAERLWTRIAGSPEVRQSICFYCPQTILWERWKNHLAGGGSRESFVPDHSANDSFNYFWNRRHAGRSDRVGQAR